MDPDIWSRLPAELLEHVLSFLPLKAFLNLRTTCKRFRSLIFSPSFVSKLHSSPHSLSSFLLLSHPHFDRLRLPLYDTSIGAWRNHSLCLSPSPLLPPAAAASSSLVSTSGGLLCFFLPCWSSLLVCNLLAKSSRMIDFPTLPFSFDLLKLIATPIGYRIFLLSSSSSATATAAAAAFVFDSKAASWRRFESPDPIVSSINYQQGGVYCREGLYFTTTSEPFSVVLFDLGTGRWGRLAAELPAELAFLRLAASDGEGGSLYMIGGMGRNGISRSMRLWVLKGEGWEEVGRPPEGMCRKLMSVCYHNYEQVYCLWHQGMVCVCCYTWPEVLYYKASRGTWHWLPKCPSLPDKWSCGFRWFSFVPQLYALV